MRRLAVYLAVSATLSLGQGSRPCAFDASAFTPLFDGRTLDGWITKGGRYDGNAQWTVEDGAICGREGPDHAAGLLYTARKYSCFILSLDVWMTRPNDSGIFLRSVPEGRGLQITLDDREDGEIGSLYADEFLSRNRTARRSWTPSAWNRVEVRVTGSDMRVEAWINGEKVTDHQVPPGTVGFATTGLIGLQVQPGRHDPPGTIVRFRAVRIRELPTFESTEFTCDANGVMTPTAAGTAAGWKPLFNGRDLSGWEVVGPADGFVVADGELGASRGVGGILRSVEDYADFDLRLDFRLSTLANSGIFLRAARTDSYPSFSGCEIQLLDDYDWERMTKTKLKPSQFTGSIIGSAPPRVAGALFPDGRWNSMRIRYQGSQLQVSLNGIALQDADVRSLPVPENARKFTDRAPSGFIGFQRQSPQQASEDPYARFRNVYVRRLP
jgi:3-keto-disaccharide hydrolase